MVDNLEQSIAKQEENPLRIFVDVGFLPVSSILKRISNDGDLNPSNVYRFLNAYASMLENFNLSETDVSRLKEAKRYLKGASYEVITKNIQKLTYLPNQNPVSIQIGTPVITALQKRYEAESEALTQEKERLAAELQEARQEISGLGEQIYNLAVIFHDLEEEHTELQTRHTDLQSDYNFGLETRNVLTQDLHASEDLNIHYKDLAEQTREDYDALVSRAVKLEASVQDLQGLTAHNKEEADVLRESVGLYQKGWQEEAELNRQLKQTVVGLEATIEVLQPKVSIYIPAYRCAEYIEQALQSALNQTYERIEVCVCVDGDEEVLRVVNKFKNENKIKWKFHEQNKGIGAASNTAIKDLATGKYIAQLDGDDFIEPNTIRRLVAFIESDPALYGGAFTDFDFVDKEGKLIQSGWKKGISFDRHYLREQGNCIKPMRIWRRDLWERTEGFDEKLQAAVDTDMMLKLDAIFEEEGLTFGHVSEVLYHYRWHGDNTSIKKRIPQIKASEFARRRATFKRLNKEQKLSQAFMPEHIDTILERVAGRKDISENMKERIAFQLENMLLNSKGGYTVLDIGCNTGIFARSLARLGYFVHGIDLSERKIEVATQGIGKLSPVLTYETADATSFRPDRKYNVINISEVLEHVPSFESIFETAKASLAENGKVFLSVPNENAVADPGHINIFDRKKLRQLAKKNGFKIQFSKPESTNLQRWIFATLELGN